MKIIIDKDINFFSSLFKQIGNVKYINGRQINNSLIKKHDILIIRSITKINKTLLHNTNIKFIGSLTSGIDHVDLLYIKKNKIKFEYTPGENAISVVEYVIRNLIFLLNKHGDTIFNKVVGIIGYGNIGKILNKYLNILGIKTFICDDPKFKILNNELNNIFSFDYVIRNSDIITIHVPLTYFDKYKTYNLFNYEVLYKLKKNCILINTSRGSIINFEDLLKILYEGKKIKLLFDVWDNEPKINSNILPFINIGTPHIAGYTLDSKLRATYKILVKLDNFINNTNYTNMYKKNKFIKIIDLRNKHKLTHNDYKNIFNITFKKFNLSQKKINDNMLNNFDLFRQKYKSRREWSNIKVL